MALKHSVIATKSSIFQPFGNTLGSGSLASVAQAASTETRAYAKSYDDEIVAYCVEWERIVTTRVDSELKETSKLHARLNHYQNKVEGLRSKQSLRWKKVRTCPRRWTRSAHATNKSSLRLGAPTSRAPLRYATYSRKSPNEGGKICTV